MHVSGVIGDNFFFFPFETRMSDRKQRTWNKHKTTVSSLRQHGSFTPSLAPRCGVLGSTVGVELDQTVWGRRLTSPGLRDTGDRSRASPLKGTAAAAPAGGTREPLRSIRKFPSASQGSHRVRHTVSTTVTPGTQLCHKSCVNPARTLTRKTPRTVSA